MVQSFKVDYAVTKRWLEFTNWCMTSSVIVLFQRKLAPYRYLEFNCPESVCHVVLCDAFLIWIPILVGTSGQIQDVIGTTDGEPWICFLVARASGVFCSHCHLLSIYIPSLVSHCNHCCFHRDSNFHLECALLLFAGSHSFFIFYTALATILTSKRRVPSMSMYSFWNLRCCKSVQVHFLYVLHKLINLSRHDFVWWGLSVMIPQEVAVND